MTDLTPKRTGRSLLERASEVYDFHAFAPPAALPEAGRPDFIAEPDATAEGLPQPAAAPASRTRAVRPGRTPVTIDRERLAEQGLLVPGAPIDALVEEFRMIKRQLLGTMRDVADPAKARQVLVCSAQPGEGKTFCALNLVLSLAAESDVEVVLVDADLAAPNVMKRLGLEPGLGLLDALADPTIDIEDLVVPTDVPQLSLLPSGTKQVNDTELLASRRTAEVIAALLAADPRRLLVFDSPPALAASPASVLAGLVGQVMLVVRADKTSEGELRDTVQLLDGCDHIQLVLNAVTFRPGGRRYGYYGQEDPQ